MDSVARRIATQGEEVVAIDQAVEQVVLLGRSNLEHAAHVAELSEALGRGVSTLHDCVGLFRLPSDPMRQARHARVRALAETGAAGIGRALAQAVARREIGVEALFARDYTAIPGIDPPKHRTSFDELCDELLPPLQEPLAAAEPWIVFAICANPDGYVPTHNQRFSQPLTGDRARDLSRQPHQADLHRPGRPQRRRAHRPLPAAGVSPRHRPDHVRPVGTGVRGRPPLGRLPDRLHARIGARARVAEGRPPRGPCPALPMVGRAGMAGHLPV